MATIIRVDGTEAEVAPQAGTFGLTELYQHTGCDHVDMIALADGRLMWADGEAYLRDPRPPVNARASELYHAAGGFPTWQIRGAVLITTNEEVD